jgi:hypothetical protein
MNTFKINLLVIHLVIPVSHVINYCI